MYLVYIDESGTTDLKLDKEPSPDGNKSLYFVLGAVFIHVRQLENIERAFSKLKREFFIDELTEIKYSMPAKYLKQGKHVEQYRTAAYKLIANSDLTLFGAHVNKYVGHAKGIIKKPDDTYLLAFQHLVAAINAYMYTSRLSEPIVVFADAMDRKHDRQVYQAYKRALLNEQLYPNFDKSIFSPSINFGSSQFTIGLQISDLVAGALWRGLELNKKDYSRMIKTKFPSSDNGDPIGYGYVRCDYWLEK
jgi:hypothetical protein